VAWLASVGADKFFDSFMATCQYAESRCVHCGQRIYLDIVEGGGCPDWRTEDGDYGCGESPDTDTVVDGEDGGTGSHTPRKLERFSYDPT